LQRWSIPEYYCTSDEKIQFYGPKKFSDDKGGEEDDERNYTANVYIKFLNETKN
jgi:hypothetical protein